MPAPAALPRSLGGRAVRIFISSTFKDMQKERNHLAASIFAWLREWCLRHRIAYSEKWLASPSRLENPGRERPANH